MAKLPTPGLSTGSGQKNVVVNAYTNDVYWVAYGKDYGVERNSDLNVSSSIGEDVSRKLNQIDGVSVIDVLLEEENTLLRKGVQSVKKDRNWQVLTKSLANKVFKSEELMQRIRAEGVDTLAIATDIPAFVAILQYPLIGSQRIPYQGTGITYNEGGVRKYSGIRIDYLNIETKKQLVQTN